MLTSAVTQIRVFVLTASTPSCARAQLDAVAHNNFSAGERCNLIPRSALSGQRLSRPHGRLSALGFARRKAELRDMCSTVRRPALFQRTRRLQATSASNDPSFSDDE
eukprot:8802103-Pyramimonas_sp.AAC.1